MKETFAPLLDVRQILNIFDPDLLLQGQSSDQEFRCHLHTIGNHYAKKEHLLMTEFSICDLDLCHQGHTNDLKCILSSIVVPNMNFRGQQMK